MPRAPRALRVSEVQGPDFKPYPFGIENELEGVDVLVFPDQSQIGLAFQAGKSGAAQRKVRAAREKSPASIMASTALAIPSPERFR